MKVFVESVLEKQKKDGASQENVTSTQSANINDDIDIPF